MVLLFLATTITLGCGPAKYEDVSDLADYTALMENEYRTRRDLQVLGITTDRNYEPVTAYYLIMGTPSIAGPEVVERRHLPAGSLVDVVKVTRCTNCALSAVRIEVGISPGEEFAGKPVFVDDRGNLVDTGADGGSTVLNPNLFESIRN